ncbi:MAG: ABC transporter ATP-binding protein [Lachnospiraceae bacterium]|nr:ABC transporter ATP-binding protein [Lachnospiraceae bacterium]
MKETNRKIRLILTQNEKWKIVVLLFLMLVGGLLEMVGVSLVLPLINMIMDNGIQDNTAISGMAVALIIIYIAKNIFLVLMYYSIFRFVYNGIARLSERMMNAYIRANYSFHLNKNVADIERAVRYDSESAFFMIKAMLQLAAEGIICLILAAFLFYTDLLMSLYLFVLLGVSCGTFLVLSKKTTKRLGKRDLESRGQMEKWILQAFGGIKELKLLGRESYFKEKVTNSRKDLSNNCKKQQLLLQLPRLFAETICIVGVMSIIIFEIIADKDLTVLIPKLAVFSVAAFRLLPSIGKVNTYITDLLFFKPAIDEVYKELIELEKIENNNSVRDSFETKPASFENKISINNLSFSYEKDAPPILNNVDFSIMKGSAVGLVGPSGAGKTTLADIIMGLLEPSDGEITVDGKNIRENIRGWQKQIGYVPQNIYLSDDTIRNNVAFGIPEKEIDDDKVWQALRKAQLEEFVKNSKEGLDTCVGDRGVRLSGGQRQRIGIARALYNDPELLVLDEATSALDNETEEAVMQAIESLHGEKTMIIIAHRLSTIEKCDVVYCVDHKKVTLM